MAAALISTTSGRIPVWATHLAKLASNTNNGAATGLLVGPHASNLLTEILMCRIDQLFSPHWDFVRSVDDFRCYVNTYEEAETFLALLGVELESHGLKINQDKTKILELPFGVTNEWPEHLQNRALFLSRSDDLVCRAELNSFMDFSIGLMAEQGNDAAVIFYALRVLSSCKLSHHAAASLARTLISLAMLYPYFVPLLGPYLFDLYPDIRSAYLTDHINDLYRLFMKDGHYEAAAFVLYYAVKYEHRFRSFDVDDIIEAGDCVLLVLALLYCRHFDQTAALRALKAHARDLKRAGLMEKYWPFIYEILPKSSLSGDWRRLKEAGVSFFKPEFRESPDPPKPPEI